MTRPFSPNARLHLQTAREQAPAEPASAPKRAPRFALPRLGAVALTVLSAAGCGTPAEEGSDDAATGVTSDPTATGTSTEGGPTSTGTGTAPMGTSTASPTGSETAGGGTTTPPANADGLVPAANGCAGQLADETGNIVISASEVNNYAFSSTLSFEPTLVAPDTNLTFDWSALTRDFLGHDLDNATEINMVSLMLWRLNQTDLETQLNDDTLVQADLVSPPAAFYPESLRTAYPEEGGTRAQLLRTIVNDAGEEVTTSDVTLFGNPLLEEEFMPFFNATTYPPEGHTFTLIAATGTVAGQGSRMIQSFILDPTSTNTTVTMTNDSTVLEYDADLQTLTPTQLPVGVAGITVDWGDIGVNAMGAEFTPTSIADVQVARYSQTPAELEGQFLDLDLIALDMFRAEVPAGTAVDLSTLTKEDGTPFAGIDANGTWIIALLCGTCRNPAPWYISVLTPCGG